MQNRELLKDRPQAFQHGDYHIGNFMKIKIYVIDFGSLGRRGSWENSIVLYGLLKLLLRLV